MNHKRKRPKNRRAGCIMCKSWKINGFRRGSKSTNYDATFYKVSEMRRLQDNIYDMIEDADDTDLNVYYM